jgi:hypothetical protein
MTNEIHNFGRKIPKEEPIGRYRHGYKDNIKMAVRQIGYEGVHLRQLRQDKIL